MLKYAGIGTKHFWGNSTFSQNTQLVQSYFGRQSCNSFKKVYYKMFWITH